MDANYRLPSYNSRCAQLISLARGRNNLSAMFIFDVLTGRVDASNLYSKLTVNESARSLRYTTYSHVYLASLVRNSGKPKAYDDTGLKQRWFQ